MDPTYVLSVSSKISQTFALGVFQYQQECVYLATTTQIDELLVKHLIKQPPPFLQRLDTGVKSGQDVSPATSD